MNFPNNSPVSANNNGAFCKVGSISENQKRGHSETVYLVWSIQELFSSNCCVVVVVVIAFVLF